jgi:hypothetical protein
MYTVYPVDGEDATSNGFHDTFWKCSPEFRDHVREAFRRRQSDDPERGIMGQYIHPEVCDCITIPPGSSEHVETKKV